MPAPALHGLIPVTATPFDAAGRLQPDALTALLRWHLAQGAQGLCVAAGNGECAAMTAEEAAIVVRTAVAATAGRVPTIAGAMGPETASVEGAVRRVRLLMEAGADAVLVTPDPTRPDASDDAVLERFAAIHAATRAPIVAYNSPRHYGVNLTPHLLGRLANAVDLAGLKEASRDFDHIGEVLHAHGARFPVFVGPGWLIMPGIALGAAGMLSTGPDLLGADAARIVGLARGSAGADRSALHRRVAGIYRLLLESGIGPPPAPLKAALGLLGVPAGLPRDPAKRITDENMRRLRDGLAELEVVG